MAREIHEREDLLRDATALVPRIQLRMMGAGKPCEVFAGFRKNGALSLYFDDDPVYHFNSTGELRRAFVDNHLLKAEEGKLIAMQPRRGETSTDLVSREMTPEQQQQFCNSALKRIAWLHAEIEAEHYELVGQMPETGEALPQLANWLANCEGIPIAQSPRVG